MPLPEYQSRQNQCRQIFSRQNFPGCIYAAGVIIVVFILILFSPVRPAAAGSALAEVLPEYGFAEDWAREEEPKLFDKDTLFNHINGEAEIYLPYGFASLATANYVNKNDRDLSVVADVYKMGSALDAFGIYSNYRKTSSFPAAIGAEGFISSSQLMFYQDRYFVRLQLSGGTGLDKNIFLSLAGTISKSLPAVYTEPKELSVIKIAALVPRSERYMAQSLLGYFFFRRGIIADAALQNEKMQIFVISEDSYAAAGHTFSQYKTYLQTEGKEIEIAGNKSRMRITGIDPLYGKVVVEHAGKHVFGAVRIKNEQLAARFVEELHERIIKSTGK